MSKPAAQTSDDDSRYPRRVVALGGGTGLPAVLRGLRGFVSSGDVTALTGVVTMSDDGGSSGRLRRTRGLPPPGDVRNCLVALSEEEDLLAGLFQHRYKGSEEIGGHTLGNLILAALAEQTGSFIDAVEVSSRVLRTVGRILPVTHDAVTLEAILDDGSSVLGESAIGDCRKSIDRLLLRPRKVSATPGIVESIRDADLIVIGPGSLYTSVLPSLILHEIAQALRETRAVRVLVANLVSERGEANGLQLTDHVDVIRDHAGGAVIDALLVHDGPIDARTLNRYREEGVEPLEAPALGLDGVRVIRRHLLAPGPKLRHDPTSTAAGLLRAWRELAMPAGASESR